MWQNQAFVSLRNQRRGAWRNRPDVKPSPRIIFRRLDLTCSENDMGIPPRNQANDISLITGAALATSEKHQ